MRGFKLSFASEAGGGAPVLGDESYGTSITLNPSFTALLEPTLRQSFSFGQVVARYVRVEATSNYFGQGGTPGGDRLGIGEIAFANTEFPGEANISVPDSVMPTLVGDATTDFTISVLNSGSQKLAISGTNLIGPSATAFSVLGAPAIIDPTSSADITLQFDPAGIGGPISATLQITSNDPDTPTAEILLSGGIAESFYPISSVTSATEPGGSDFYLTTNLIQGPGTGFDALWPHDALGFSEAYVWVTDAPNVGPGGGDYFDPVPAVRPNMVFDLGSDVDLGEISFWGYADSNANGANLFSLRFATSADGPDGFGASISYSPEFAAI